MTHQGLTEQTRKIVDKLVETLFVNRDLEGFADLVSDEEYIQHNPLIADGKGPVLEFLSAIMRAAPDDKLEILRVIVDGDTGVIHGITKSGHSLVDMFRVRDGKLVEHWDVMNLTPNLGAPPAA